MAETREPKPKIVRVVKMNDTKYVRVDPKEEVGTAFYEYYHKDGAYSLLRIPSAPEAPKKMQPICCQQGTPGGDVPI